MQKSEIGVPKTGKKRIVIAGGGFGGLELVRKLSCDRFQIILVDKNNYHTFQPLLYQSSDNGSGDFKKGFVGARFMPTGLR